MVNTFGNTVNRCGYVTTFCGGVPVATGCDSTYGVFSTGYFSNWNIDRGDFSMVTGAITTAGSYIYDSETVGSGLLHNPMIANRGSVTVYFGTDSSTISIANGTPLETGESYVIESDVRKLWAISASATGLLSVHSTYSYNRDMI